jgi:Zn-finger nucleic acid-binding protein
LRNKLASFDRAGATAGEVTPHGDATRAVVSYPPAVNALRCPRCRTDLAPASRNGARFDRCATCRGVSFNLAVIRQFVPHDRVARFWRGAVDGRASAGCPSCSNAMASIAAAHAGRELELDACRRCQLLWFDAGELVAFSPERQAPPRSSAHLSPAGAEALVGALPTAERLGDEALADAGDVLLVLATLLDGV